VRFAFTSEQMALRDGVRALLKRECPPARVREAWTSADGRVPGLWGKLAEAGVLGVLAPEDEGGLGLTEIDLVLLLEEHGRAAVPEPVTEAAAVAVPLLRDFARDPHRAAWLCAVASGQAIVSVGLSGGPVLGAESADVLLLAHGDEVHAVPRSEARLEAQPSIDGARRLARVAWTPGAATLVTADPAALAGARDRGAVAAAAELLGLARAMLDVTVEYAKTRKQFGLPIGGFQAVKHHLADAVVAIEMAAPVVYRAAYALAGREADRSIAASMAKAVASDAAVLMVRKALQCHGAIGYAFENDLHMWMKRAWALAAAWGDAAAHRGRVASKLFGEGGVE
jgi:alkylation response protein AidB-like acyl-CoA dehydrogenase